MWKNIGPMLANEPQMTDRGVADPKNRQQILTRRSKPFSRMTIKNILNNKTYIGRIVHNGVETKATHPPIVSTRLWNRCNQMLSGNRV